MTSGESTVCRRTLEHSAFDYDVCCGPVDGAGNEHIRLFPQKGNKYLVWPLAVAKQFERLMETEQYEVMMSRVMPPNGHLAGWLIKRRHPEIKWIAYFSDPVWNSPFLKFSLRDDGSHRPKWLLMKVFGLPCKWALRRADVLMFNNERLARYVLGRRYERYRHKVLIAPYGHEGVRPRPAPEREDGKFRLTHVGQIYGERTFTQLIEGLVLLREQNPTLYEQLEVRQVGFVCEGERRRVMCSSVVDRFTFVEPVPYAESIEEMYRADCLLVIDPVFDRPEKNIYIPGKIFDYMSTGRPIFCVAQADSATGDVAQITSGVETGLRAQEICRLIEKYSRRKNSVSDFTPFHCRNGVQALDRAIGELHK